MSYRDDVDALRARHDALQHEVAQHTDELATTRGLLDEAERKSRLPILDNIRVASPCSADWSKMTGDERVRSCADCNKHVYNISELTREDAQALIVEHEGKLCVRYFQRADGTILLKDCTVGVRRRRRVRIVAGAAALLAGTGVAAAFHTTGTTIAPAPVTVELYQMRAPAPLPTPTVSPAARIDPHQWQEMKGGASFHAEPLPSRKPALKR